MVNKIERLINSIKLQFVMILVLLLLIITGCKNEDSARIVNIFAPIVITSTVNSGNIDVVMDSTFEIQFIEALDSISATANSIYLKDNSSDSLVSSCVSYS